MIDIKELIDQLDSDSVIDILDDLGSPCFGRGTTSDGNDYLTFKTICHGGDSEGKLYWYENTKMFHCYTCCGSMSIFDLVKKVRGYTSFSQCLSYVAQKLGVSFSNSRNTLGEIQMNPKERAASARMDLRRERLERLHKSTPSITNFYDKKYLKIFDYDAFYPGWIEEGITVDSMRKFQISFYWNEGYIIIPHFDVNGNLIGIRRRSLNPEDAKNKYMPLILGDMSFEHPLGLNLYGLKENIEAIKRYKTAYIVEGEKSVLKSDGYFGDKSLAVATCGFNISEWQIRTLSEIGVNKLYLCFDKDFDTSEKMKAIYTERSELTKRKYEHYIERLNNLCKRSSSAFNVYLVQDLHDKLEIKDSPFDKGKEIFEQLRDEAQLYI